MERGKSLERVGDLFYTAVCRAQAGGDVPKTADARSQSLFLVTNCGGLRATVRTGASPEKPCTKVEFMMNSLK